jgi:hypothetical protein
LKQRVKDAGGYQKAKSRQIEDERASELIQDILKWNVVVNDTDAIPESIKLQKSMKCCFGVHYWLKLLSAEKQNTSTQRI